MYFNICIAYFWQLLLLKIQTTINSLPNDKILDWIKLKAFAVGKIKAAKMFFCL